jgi:anti-sigma factor RsiW
MDYNAQLKLQALLDGELPKAEASEVTNWVAQDREAAALLGELRRTRDALAGTETGVHLPESREFFWSKVQREIQRLEAPAPKPAQPSYLTIFRRLLVPASTVAVVLIAGLVLIRSTLTPGLTTTSVLETAVADSGAFTYRDYSAGATLVWLSYPADNEVAEPDEMGMVE